VINYERVLFPVIIFSHGAGSSKDGNERLLSYWASFGYIVIAPSHPDGIPGFQPGESFATYMQRTLSAVGQNPDEWKERPRDISFVIDSLPQIERDVPALQGHSDATRIGVSGHSYGADTTMLIAGATMTLPGTSKPQSFVDPRVLAAIMFSPQGVGVFGLRSDSWDAMRMPSMIITGSNDRVQTGADPSTRREPFNGEPPGDKYFVSIEGANHFSVTGARFLGPSEDPILTEMDVVSLAFWDAYLKQQPVAFAYLRSGALPNMGRPAVTLDRK
jgi:predicted dienelactone hydrolase